MYAHKIFIKKVKRRISKKAYRLWDATRYNQKHQVKKWYSDGGNDKEWRYTYPLTKGSVVFDVGGYEGEWTETICKKYDCQVYVFEPVKEYYEKLEKKFMNNKKIHVFGFGLAGRTHTAKISHQAESSSTFKRSSDSETINLVDIKSFCDEHKIGKIDLIKINIEGGEYELLDRILATGLIRKIDRLLIQFHDFVLNGELKMEGIQRKLSKTHKPTFQYWFVWENWIKKGFKN